MNILICTNFLCSELKELHCLKNSSRDYVENIKMAIKILATSNEYSANDEYSPKPYLFF